MRRRINRQVNKEVKEEIKPIEKKEENKEVKVKEVRPKTEFKVTDICTNMLPDLQYNKDKSVVNDLTTKNGINDFLKFLFTNVLQFKYKDATNKDVILDGDAEWVNTTSYYYPTEYLLAGSVLIYVTDRCAYGFVIDRVFNGVDNTEQSSVEIYTF